MLTQQQKQFIREHENDDVYALALRKSLFEGMDMSFLLAQIAGRQIAKRKIPSWYACDDLIYPPHLSMEQASSELTAQFKASVMGNVNSFVDLTGGLGVDFSWMSSRAQKATYVEQNPDLCELAKHNFSSLQINNISIENGSAELFVEKMNRVDAIYLDPARRANSGQKVFRIEVCLPNVKEIQGLLLGKASYVMIKYSPMLDISLATQTLSCVKDVYAVSVENECKELLFILQKGKTQSLYHAVNLFTQKEADLFTFSPEAVYESRYASEVGKYLYEPNTSLMKIGAFDAIASKYKISKLHKHSHLYTSDEYIADFQGRIFKIENCFIPNKQNLKSFLSETPKANITVRNYPLSVAQIRQQTGIKEGGEVYVFATTLAHEQKVWLVCRKI